MAPSKLPREDCTALSAQAANGVDQLWKFQLRKEHKAIQEKLDAVLASEAEIKDRQEHLARLVLEFETGLHSLKQEMRNQEDAREAGLASLRIQIDELQRKIIPEDKIKALLAKQEKKKFETLPSPSKGPSSDGTTATISDSPNNTANAVTLPQPNQPNQAIPSEVPQSNQLPAPTKRSSNRVTKRPAKRRAKKKPVKPATKPTAQLPQIVDVSKFHKLSQGSDSIGVYYANTDKLHASLSFADGTLDYKYVNAFVKGLACETDKSVLISELQQHHRSITTADRTVEIECQWNDVEDALRASSLLPANDP